MGRSELLGLWEVRTTIFYRRLLSEFLATTFLVILLCGSGLAVNPPYTPTVTSFTVTTGFGVASIVWTFGHVSGAHINPCVSIALLVTRKISLTRCLAYIVMQCAGATAGTGVLWGLTPADRRGTLAATTVADNVSLWQAVLVEMVITYFLLLAVFATLDMQRVDHAGSAALSVGLVVATNIPWAVQYTGASMNPARSFGPSVVTGLWKDHWVYWVGPIVGAVAGALTYDHAFDQRHLQSRGDNTDCNMELYVRDHGDPHSKEQLERSAHHRVKSID